MTDEVWFIVVSVLLLTIFILIVWNINLQIQNYTLNKDLLERERWHYREIRKYQERDL